MFYWFGINAHGGVPLAPRLRHIRSPEPNLMTGNRKHDTVDLFCPFCREAMHVQVRCTILIHRVFSTLQYRRRHAPDFRQTKSVTPSTTQQYSKMSISRGAGRVRAYRSPRHLPESSILFLFTWCVSDTTRIAMVSVICGKASKIALDHQSSHHFKRHSSRRHDCDCRADQFTLMTDTHDCIHRQK